MFQSKRALVSIITVLTSHSHFLNFPAFAVLTTLDRKRHSVKKLSIHNLIIIKINRIKIGNQVPYN